MRPVGPINPDWQHTITGARMKLTQTVQATQSILLAQAAESSTALQYRLVKTKQSYLSPVTAHSSVGQLWRIHTVVNETGLSKTELYRRIAAGSFPAPVKLGAKAVAWSSLAVQAWIHNVIQGGAQ
jgi:prophage regulatory protein